METIMIKPCTTTVSPLLVDYPEKNLFDVDPPIFNLTPFDRDEEAEEDLPEFIAAAQLQTKRTGSNPLYMWYGSNPLVVQPSYDTELPLTSYQRPPPLPKAEFEGPIEFLERLNPHGTSHTFKVRIGDDIRFLKVFPDRDRDEEEDEDIVGLAMLRFRRESEAYAHLLHYGVDKTGVVPHCYGWFDLKDEDVERASAFPPIVHEGEDDIQPLTVTTRPPKCILLEYFSDATALTLSNITADIADTALRALWQIHTAYVMHGDIEPRNILLLPEDRVVWVDFDNAVCASERRKDRKINRRILLDELSYGWGLFYTTMLPDKRVWFPHEWSDPHSVMAQPDHEV